MASAASAAFPREDSRRLPRRDAPPSHPPSTSRRRRVSSARARVPDGGDDAGHPLGDGRAERDENVSEPGFEPEPARCEPRAVGRGRQAPVGIRARAGLVTGRNPTSLVAAAVAVAAAARGVKLTDAETAAAARASVESARKAHAALDANSSSFRERTSGDAPRRSRPSPPSYPSRSRGSPRRWPNEPPRRRERVGDRGKETARRRGRRRGTETTEETEGTEETEETARRSERTPPRPPATRRLVGRDARLVSRARGGSDQSRGAGGDGQGGRRERARPRRRFVARTVGTRRGARGRERTRERTGGDVSRETTGEVETAVAGRRETRSFAKRSNVGHARARRTGRRRDRDEGDRRREFQDGPPGAGSGETVPPRRRARRESRGGATSSCNAFSWRACPTVFFSKREVCT